MTKINKILLLVLAVVVLFFGTNLLGDKFRQKLDQNQIAQSKSVISQVDKFASEESEGGNVTVIVVPKNLKVGEKPEFEVKFETHSVDLDFDVSQVSKLSDDQGNILTVPSWEGSPPGGHHRKGILTFESSLSEAEYVELVILNIAGIEERRFKWRL